MPENVDCIDRQAAVSDIFSLLLFFFFFFYHLLDCKSFLTNFDFFFLFNKNSLSLSFSLCLKLPLTGTYTERKPYRCYISQARYNHFYIIFLRLLGVVPYMELPPLKGKAYAWIKAYA